MRKHILFLGAALNALTLYLYLADNIVPHKFTISMWGIFTILMLFLEALKYYYIEKSSVLVKQEFNEKIAPILNNTHLTKEEKQDRINEIIAEKIVDRIAKQSNIQKKENNNE